MSIPTRNRTSSIPIFARTKRIWAVIVSFILIATSVILVSPRPLQALSIQPLICGPAFEVRDGMLNGYEQFQATATHNSLGCPLNNEHSYTLQPAEQLQMFGTQGPFRTGQRQDFEWGSLYWHPGWSHARLLKGAAETEEGSLYVTAAGELTCLTDLAADTLGVANGAEGYLNQSAKVDSLVESGAIKATAIPTLSKSAEQILGSACFVVSFADWAKNLHNGEFADWSVATKATVNLACEGIGVGSAFASGKSAGAVAQRSPGGKSLFYGTVFCVSFEVTDKVDGFLGISDFLVDVIAGGYKQIALESEKQFWYQAELLQLQKDHTEPTTGVVYASGPAIAETPPLRIPGSTATNNPPKALTPDELILHDGSSGQARIHNLTSDFKVGTKLHEGQWRKGWDIIIAVDADGDGKHELFMYDRRDGAARIYNLTDDGKVGRVYWEGSWRTTWTTIIAADTDGA